MPRVRSFKTSFNAGEIIPLADARADISSYANGADRLVNWRQLIQGGISRRPGMEKKITLVNGVKYQLERFIFDDNQRYVFIFSEGQVEIVDDSDGTSSFTLAGQPWTAVDVGDLTVSSEGDVTIVCSGHGNWPMRQLTRTGVLTFTSADFTFETNSAGKKFVPFYKYADDSITIDPSGTSGNITVIASAAYFQAAHVGLIIRHKGKQIEITGFNSPTSVNGTVIETLTDANDTEDWDEEVFSSIYGYAVSSVFHDQRLHFAGHKSLPRHYFASNVGAFFKFDVGTGQDNESLQGVAAESNIGAIKAIASLRQLQLFADQGEVYIPATEAKPLTPANLAFKIQSRYGTSVHHVADFDTSTLYISNGGAVREFLFDELQSGFESFSLTFLSRHLLKGASRITSQLEGFGNQEQYAFVVNGDDGTMAVLLNERNERVTAWSEWITEGTIVDAIAVGNNVYAIVEREVDGIPVTWFEQFKLDFTLDGATRQADVVVKSVWTGLTDYANQEVSVVSGNFYLGDFTVSPAGVLDLGDIEVDNIDLGYNYTPIAITLPPEVQLDDGPTFGELRRVIKVVLLFQDTLNAIVSGNKLIIRQTVEDLTEEPTPIEARKEFYLRGWDRKGQVEIRQDVPLPLTILGMNIELEF